jgi:tetratricopeptide (TPR) repeat protein
MPAAQSDARFDRRSSPPQALLHGPVHSALREAAKALDLAQQYSMPLEMCLALAQMGRCYRAVQALAPAEAYLEQAFRWAGVLGAVDQGLELLCQLAEISCTLAENLQRSDAQASDAALERTRDRASEASAMAAHVADPQWEIKVLLRISDVLDRCGDHDDAVQLQSRALRLIYGAHAGSGPDESTLPD